MILSLLWAYALPCASANVGIKGVLASNLCLQAPGVYICAVGVLTTMFYFYFFFSYIYVVGVLKTVRL